MAIGNLDNVPQFASSAYASSTHNLNNLGAVGGWVEPTITDPTFILGSAGGLLGRAAGAKAPLKGRQAVSIETEEEDMANPSRRLVKVIIVDPNENIPLDQCVLYSGEEKLTDLNDQELFFELDIKALLATHNEKRIKVVDKKVKERVEHLEPAKIRDLKMVVVNIASF